MNLRRLAICVAFTSLPLLGQAVQAEENLTPKNRLIAEGEGLAKGGRWQKAQELFLQACSEDPSNVVALHDLAVSYAHTDKLAEAADCERKALAIDENYVPAHIELAWVLGRLNDKEAAREHLKRALEIEPKNLSAKKNLEALSLPHSRKTVPQNQPLVELSSAASTKPERVTETAVSKALIARAGSSFRQGKYAVAKRLLEQALENCPDSVAARASLGVVLGSTGDYQGQIAQEKKAIEIEPKNAALHINLAWALAQKGDLQEALESYQHALELNPKSLEAQAGQGLLLYRLGKKEAAIAVLKEAVRVNPEASQLRMAYGAVLQGIGRNPEAINELLDTVKLSQNNSDAKVRLAAAYLDGAEYAKANELYKQLVERYPANAELRIGYGLSLTKMDDINSAYLQFKKAAELDKNLAAAHACISMVEEMRGRLGQAESAARTALEKDPDSEFLKESAERIARSRSVGEM
ncbi:MAG: tetratricopeptide repeat protein [Candidatus Obscuribacterales bacterium]|nr:tetratricopeptide repeat protein [Candidatus Obscuribacterales bacterium]